MRKRPKIKTKNFEDFDIIEFNTEDKQTNKIVFEKLKQNFPK